MSRCWGLSPCVPHRVIGERLGAWKERCTREALESSQPRGTRHEYSRYNYRTTEQPPSPRWTPHRGDPGDTKPLGTLCHMGDPQSGQCRDSSTCRIKGAVQCSAPHSTPLPLGTSHFPMSLSPCIRDVVATPRLPVSQHPLLVSAHPSHCSPHLSPRSRSRDVPAHSLPRGHIGAQ